MAQLDVMEFSGFLGHELKHTLHCGLLFRDLRGTVMFEVRLVLAKEAGKWPCERDEDILRVQYHETEG